ncbi:MAG: ribonuclease R [Armatimonadetes bacterium]|nr:ribonuclease R [Armatimonadota bacterium]
MYDSKLAFQIKKLLSDNNVNRLKIKDISKAIKVKKHKHKDLIDTLFKLAKDQDIKLKNRKYSSFAKLDYIEGIFDARPLARNKSFAFVITDKFDVYISSEDTLNAYHDDEVLIEVKYSKNQKKYGIINKIIKRNKELFVGQIQEYHGNYYLISDNSRIHTNFKINDLATASTQDKVVLKITNWGNRELQRLPVGNIVEILGKAGNPEVEILSIIKNYELPLSFPENVIKEVIDLSDEITDEEISKRKDFRKLVTFTIDPASAKDFDDAISLEKTSNGWRLYVHIADVAHYIKHDSLLFKEAVKRGNSYYFPKKVIPMLPEKISNKICSLRPFEDKLTISVITDFDDFFQILDQKVCESIINSNARFSYDEIDLLFEDSNLQIPEEIANILHQMKTLSSALSEQRKKHGYLRFDLPEPEFIFDDKGYIIDIRRSMETESHRLIENFMLIANEFIAKQLSHQNTIYRVHEKPDDEDVIKVKELTKKHGLKFPLEINLNYAFQELLNSMPNDDYHRVFDRIILRNLKKAKYQIENLDHFGLGIKTYTHFTSPIRRLCDLIIHHQIKQNLISSKNTFTLKKLSELAHIASEKELIADYAEREVNNKNKLTFIKKKLGETFSGIIISMNNSSLFVELDKYPITGLVPFSSLKKDYYQFYKEYLRLIGKRTGKILKLTDKVEVLISRVDNDVYFQLIGE